MGVFFYTIVSWILNGSKSLQISRTFLILKLLWSGLYRFFLYSFILLILFWRSFRTAELFRSSTILFFIYFFWWLHCIYIYIYIYIGWPKNKKNKIRIILLYFCRSNKKVYGFCFLGSLCIYIYIYIILIYNILIYIRRERK